MYLFCGISCKLSYVTRPVCFIGLAGNYSYQANNAMYYNCSTYLALSVNYLEASLNYQEQSNNSCMVTKD